MNNLIMSQQVQEILKSSRFQKAQAIAKFGGVHKFHDDNSSNKWLVRSQSNPKKYYTVCFEAGRENCTCADFAFIGQMGGLCKHMLSVICSSHKL